MTVHQVWGDAVNIASRMESTAPQNTIQVTPICYNRLKDQHLFTEKSVEVKGKGLMRTYIHKPERNSLGAPKFKSDTDSLSSKRSAKNLLTINYQED